MIDFLNPSYTLNLNANVFSYNMGWTSGINPWSFGGSVFPWGFNSGFNFDMFTPQSSFYGSSWMGMSGPQQYMQNGMQSPISNKFQYYDPWGQPVSGTSSSSSTKSAETSKTKSTDNVSKSDKTKKKTTPKRPIGLDFVDNAKKYLGYNETDGSSKKFSESGEWCADFVAYVVKESYEQRGQKAPAGLIEMKPGRNNRRVEDMKQWAIDNNKFLRTSDKKNKAKVIAENVKSGDILILRENGASHIGFVTKVNEDGTFETIEGNRTIQKEDGTNFDRVARARYSPDYSEISGFIQLR